MVAETSRDPSKDTFEVRPAKSWQISDLKKKLVEEITTLFDEQVFFKMLSVDEKLKFLDEVKINGKNEEEITVIKESLEAVDISSGLSIEKY